MKGLKLKPLSIGVDNRAYHEDMFYTPAARSPNRGQDIFTTNRSSSLDVPTTYLGHTPPTADSDFHTPCAEILSFPRGVSSQTSLVRSPEHANFTSYRQLSHTVNT